MANIIKQITLTEKGLGAGPYFDIYYSLDCVNYVLATGGSGVYLPSVGSTTSVIVDDGLQCLKLVNNSKRCFYNSEVQTFTTTTTTSTTTTTTTLAPTLNLYSYTPTGTGESFTDWMGNVQPFTFSGINLRFIAYSNGFTINNPAGLAIVQSNVTPSFNNYRFQRINGGLLAGTVAWQNTDGSVEGYSTLAATLFVKCAVTNTAVKNDPGNRWTITDLGACNVTTTSTTTTTTSACTLITFDGNITHAGLTAYWTDCDGTPRSQFVPADTTYGPLCVRTGTASGQAFTSAGPCTITTSTTSTTSTTTTQSPAIRISDTLTTVCSGGGSSVTTITYSGGTSICDATSISATSFITLGIGNYYIYDPALGYAQYYKSTIPGGGTSMTKVGIGCSPCPTTTTTTTTTTAAPTQTAEWFWTNNNTVEAPAFGGGYIQIAVNGSNVVYQTGYDTSTTTYSGSFAYAPGDSIATTVYSYSNNSYGTDTALSIDNPVGTNIYNSSDTQPNPGSPSSVANTFTAAAGGITIVGNSNSY